LPSARPGEKSAFTSFTSCSLAPRSGERVRVRG